MRAWTLKFDPPTVGLRYTKEGETVLRSIAVPREVLLDPETNASGLATVLLPHFCPPLSARSSSTQLERVLQRLVSTARGEVEVEGGSEDRFPATSDDAAPLSKTVRLKESLDRALDADAAHDAELLKKDLSKLGDEDVQKAKSMMDVEFEKNKLQKGDAGFEYDKRVDFAEPTEASPWDSESD